MRGSSAIAAVTVALLCSLAACVPGVQDPPPPSPAPVWTDGRSSGYIELADELRAQGLWVRPGRPMEQPFFGARGQVMWVQWKPVQVFDYPSEAARAEDSATVAPRGQRIGSRPVDWSATPHFWFEDTRIVLYTGDDPLIIGALTRALGRPLTPAPRPS